MLATKLFDVECHQTEHRPVIEWGREHINITFPSVSYETIDIKIDQTDVGPMDPSTAKKGRKTSGWPLTQYQFCRAEFCNRTSVTSIHTECRKEVQLMHQEQIQFLDLSMTVRRSFHYIMRTSGSAAVLSTFFLTIMDKHIYLAHHNIPQQLQDEVHKF